DFFIHHRDNPASELHISSPHKSRLTNTWRFTLSRPLRDANGRFIGLVGIGFETGYFEKFYKTIEVGKKGRIILATVGGNILIQEPFAENAFLKDFKNALIFRKYLPKAPLGTFHTETSPLDLTSRIVSYSSLSGLPVVSIISYDKAEIVAAWRSNVYINGLILCLLFIFIVPLSYVFLRQLRRLEMASQQLETQQQELVIKAKMVDSALDSILLLDEDGRLLQFNSALCNLTGRSRQELETMKLQDVVSPDKADEVGGRIQQILAFGQAVFDSEYMHISGSAVPIQGHARSVVIGQRQLVLSVVRDVSAQKEFEQTLQKTSREWRDTFDAIEDAVWLLDMDRRIVRANKSTQRIFGKSMQQVTGLHCCQVTYNKVESRDDCPFEHMLKTGKRASCQFFRNHRWFEVSVDPVVSAEGEIINAIYIVKDITLLKMSELREHFRGEILERIARNEPLSQLLLFIATAIEKISPDVLCSIMLAAEDGKRLLSTAAPSLPDFYSNATNRIKIAEGVGACGTAAFRKQRVVIEDIDTHPFWKGFTPAQEAGLRSCWSEPIISSSGQLLGTFAVYHRQPAVPGDEEVLMIEQAAAFTAIALERSRSEMERAELEHQLGQSQKMEAIGHLAGGIAHDFNNLLTPIIIYAGLLKRALANEEKLLPKVEGILDASHKASDLTQQLLSFSRKQVIQMVVVDLNEVLSSFYSIMRRTVRESIDIDLRLSSQAAFISADRSKLDQIVLNMAINAQDAISDTGKILIETGQIMIDDECSRLHPGMKAGNYILMSFKDNGCGMSDDTLRHIFEPFYTTKQVGQGTGLGLANVYGIVKQHNGFIEAASEVGSGTTFNVYFPQANEHPEKVNDTEAYSGSDYAGSGTILFVEDNGMVRAMTAELLESFGYRVYIAEDPGQALELVKNITEKIDLLITDVIMPGMNGKQLFERINDERPDIERVLYISGYTNNITVTGISLEGDMHFLPKPFTVDALMAKVRELLQPVQALSGEVHVL
ncbi:MAG: PAS domain S-box protein, partial [Geobacteraceae bacterium]|nr:PAS domain S-box protein [Geobacteraceae bacterium]